MPETLFVSNLPHQTTDLDLETIFSRHGRVLRAWIVTDTSEAPRQQPAGRKPTQHKGSCKGYVEVHPEDVEQVILVLNGSWYKTNVIDVQTEAQRRQRNRMPRERTVFTSSRY